MASDMVELRAALSQGQANSPQVHVNPQQGATTQFQNPTQPGRYDPPSSYGPAPYPHNQPMGYPSYGASAAPKSKSLALFLCFLGVHRFYLGHTASAVVFLILELLGFTNCFCLIIVAIWGTIDFFRIAANQMPDSQGVIPA